MGERGIQQGDEADGEKNQTAKVHQASVSKYAAAVVALPIASWVGIMEKIIGLGVVRREISSPGFGVG